MGHCRVARDLILVGRLYPAADGRLLTYHGGEKCNKIEKNLDLRQRFVIFCRFMLNRRLVPRRGGADVQSEALRHGIVEKLSEPQKSCKILFV